MSVKEIKEAMEKGKVLFGIKQAIKNKKKISNVFVAKDIREEVIEKLEKDGIEFVVLKSKRELGKELNLDFDCEVFSII
jgi:ribosomal protein L7Ae-like RNA K-turn-binding protein